MARPPGSGSPEAPWHVKVPPCSQKSSARGCRRHCPVRGKRVHVPYECGPGRCFFPDAVAPHGSHEWGNSPPFDNLIILRSRPCLVWPLFCKVPRPWMPPPCGRQGKNVSTSPMNAARALFFPEPRGPTRIPRAGKLTPTRVRNPPSEKTNY